MKCYPSKLGFVFLALLSSSFPAQSKTMVVRNSIADTLAEASNGDSVLIEGPRGFHEHVVVTNGVHLLGTNPPVLDGDGEGTPLVLAAPHATASGLIIRNSGHDLTKLDAGVLISADHVAVKDCRIENDSFGIYLRGANNCSIEHNSVLGN